MADDAENRDYSDRIDVHETHELLCSSKEFGVTHDQLRAAVRQTGRMVEDVERELSDE
jgi:uncharacterized protein DUF3606